MAKILGFKGVTFWNDLVVIRNDGTFFKVKQKPSFHSHVTKELRGMFVEKGFSGEVARKKADELFDELNPT